MITCKKCGYDKAVQGLNEIWCDKCDVTKHFPSPKRFPPIQARVVLDGNADTPVKYVDEVGQPYQPSAWDWQLPDGRIMSGTGFAYPVTYHSNALPSQPFDEAMGDCTILTVAGDSMKVSRLPDSPEYTLDETAKLDLSAHRFTRIEDAWEQADEYFAKNALCLFVRNFFSEEMPGYQMHLSHGVGCDMWRASIWEKNAGHDVVTYFHKNIESLCLVLETAIDERVGTAANSVMDIVRTAIEDYFNED